MVEAQLPFDIGCDAGARGWWGDLGLTLADRGRALDLLVEEGRARLVVQKYSIRAELPVAITRKGDPQP
jgi:hypothetical protein